LRAAFTAYSQKVKMMKGLVFDIRRFTVHDGPGIRTTVFFKGCPLSCSWCHNPESQYGFPETTIKNISLEGRIFKEEEVSGLWIDVDEIIEEVEKDRVFYDESGGGITVSGGEPTFQADFLLALLSEMKARRLNVAMDTCGFADWSRLALTMNYVDLYLYDLKLMDDALHLKYTGVSNKQILENLLKLAESGKEIIIRVPVIPGINDSDENFGALQLFLEQIKHQVREINLLPYHAAAGNKYKRFGKLNSMKNIKSMPAEVLQGRKDELEGLGYTVKTGG
jgi:pyruvate formate lyase activating enzyme